jgi:serine/threonine-protein kinase RsbW
MKSLTRNRIEACRQEIVPDDEGAKAWRREVVLSVADIARVVKGVADAMIADDYPEEELYRVHLALEEALVNAHKHGHGGDWDKPVVVRYHVGSDGVVVQVEDKGRGFNPALVPDPLAPENLERPSGRGLLIMRTFLSGVCHSEQGNTICLCKHRRGERTELQRHNAAPA